MSNTDLATPRERRWRKLAWPLAGAAYGLVLRVVFGAFPSTTQGVMSLAFLVGAPLAVGAITVYGSPRARASLAFAFSEPQIPMALMLVGSALALLEGSICIAIMTPLFMLVAGLGGVLMNLLLRSLRWQRSTLGAFGLAPLLLMPLDRAPMPDTRHELRESIVVGAPPQVVWRQIVSARDIRADELPASLVHLIGVPRPIGAENLATPQGETRFSRWEKGVHFTATVVDKREFESITWRYSFAPDSFPPGSMDDHVAIGGKYLDLGDTTFNLEATPEGGTRLEVVGRYRLSTPINGYAIPVSKILGRDFLRTLLGLYKGRAERAA